MTDSEQREAARKFAQKWLKGGKEEQDGRSYWFDLLQRVFGIENVTDYINFEKTVPVKDKDGIIHPCRIDEYIPSVKVLIEMKGSEFALDVPELRLGEWVTPDEQAMKYYNALPYEERGRWIVTCNFTNIWIYDMNKPLDPPTKIKLSELETKYNKLLFLVDTDVKEISHEMELSIAAGDIVGKIYDAFYGQYHIPEPEKGESTEKKEEREQKLEWLNTLCVRIVFCLYAEDAGLFGKKNMFHDYLLPKPVDECRSALKRLFENLDIKEENRNEYLEEDIAQFPYVNGGLFEKEIEIPRFTPEIKELILKEASEDFDWKEISPTIFGAVFESTLNPDTRRNGGMHYTSIENIHKVIDPLFLDNLKDELDKICNMQTIKKKQAALDEFQTKIAGLTFFDPACGSGNFLTETYLSLRRLENKVLSEKEKTRYKKDLDNFGHIEGQLSFGSDYSSYNPVKVSIQQFYGLEINDFAVTVAKTALWIAESQMLEETKSILYDFREDFLPLKTYVNITQANSLHYDWNKVISATRLDYIMGNPPFVGARLMSGEQKQDINKIFDGWKNVGNLDYVSGWYKKAADYIKGTSIHVALVSTNSVVQGDSVATLWEPLLNDGIYINFGWRTFRWDSEAHIKAHVHCVIVGFSRKDNKDKKIYSTSYEKDIDNNTVERISISSVKRINAYLVDYDNIYIRNRTKPLCDVPELLTGSQRIDNDNYIFTADERNEFIRSEPLSEKFFYTWYGGDEFLYNRPRYCLWLGNCTPAELRKMPHVIKLVNNVREYRSNSNRVQTRRCADRPTHFGLEVIPKTDFIIMPVVSSEKRRIIPMGFMHPGVICSNQVNMIPNASLYEFGILESNVHMAWMRQVAGRLKSDYRYSKGLVYNNFPWPVVNDATKQEIIKTAQGILDARALYPDSNLADLYDPDVMPSELLKAHQKNNMAVMKAYGFYKRAGNKSELYSELETVSALMQMYQQLVQEM